MKLRLPLLLRLALLSTAAAYTLGSGCLFADDAPADAAQDDPIAEAVDEEEGDSPAIGFEGYTESQLVDIQSSDSAGAVIRQMLENSTTGAVANVGTTSSTSNGATTAAAESPALTLSAPAEPVTDTALTTSTLSDSAGEGAVAPFFSAEEAAALAIESTVTSTPSLKNASTATLSSSDSSDETTSSTSATGASSSIASVGSASAGGSVAFSGGGSASYSLTSSAPDSSSSSLVITTPTDDSSSDPIAEDVLEDSTTEDTTTSTTLPDSSASTLASSTSSATTRTLPPLKLLGATGDSVTVVDGGSSTTMGDSFNEKYGVKYSNEGKLGDTNLVGNIVYLNGTHNLPELKLSGQSFWVCPDVDGTVFKITTLTTSTSSSTVKFQNNEWHNTWGGGDRSMSVNIETLSVNGSASLEVNQTHNGAITVSIGKVENSSTESTTGPLLTSVTNSGVLTLGTAATEVEAASTISTGSITNTNSGTLNLYGNLSTTSTISNSGTIVLGSGVSLSFDSLENLEKWYHDSKDTSGTARNSGYLSGRYLIKGGMVTKTDESMSATCGDESYTLDFSSSDGVVMTINPQSRGVYYISSGDSLLYGDAGNSMADDTTTSIVLNGGTFQLGETALGKAVGLSQASTLQLNKEATFAASSVVAFNAGSGQIATNGNTLSLSGSGTYTISLNSGNQFTSSSLGSNVQLKTGNDGWKGTITLTGGSSSAGKPHNLTGLFNGSYSIIEMKGVTGWTDTWGGTEAANIKLTDVTDGSTTTYAWTNGAYVSGDGDTQTCTFTGTWSGKGTFCADTGTATTGTHKQNYTYQGDISGWTGRFLLDKAIMTMTLRFADNANRVNAAIEQNKGTLNITAAATGETTFANAIKASSLTATTALKLSAKKEGETYVATEDILTGALNASGQAVTIDNEQVTLKVTGATTAASFSNAGKAYLNGGAVITGVLSNTGTLSLGGTSTVGKIEGAATVSGNLTLTGVNSVYHSGGTLDFGDSSVLTLGSGKYLNEDSYQIGSISGSSVLNENSTVNLYGLAGRQTATYSGNGDSAVIEISGAPFDLEWSNESGGEWSTDRSLEKYQNWTAGGNDEYFYTRDNVSIGGFEVTTVGDLWAGSVALNGTTLKIGQGSSFRADSMAISGITIIDNSANGSVYTQSSVTLSNGTSLTLKNTNLTAGGTTAGGTLTVDGNGTLTLISSSVLQDLFINGGIVKTERFDNGTAQISGTVTVKAGGTYLVSGTKDDGLGWGENATRAIKLLAGDENTHAVLDLNGKRSTATTLLYLNGYAIVQNGTWDPYGTNSQPSGTQAGGTINVSGTGNVFSANIRFRGDGNQNPTFNVEENAEVEMRGQFEYYSGPTKILQKQGLGLLTVTGESGIANAVSVQAGTLKLAGTAGKVGRGAITLGSNAVLELAHTAACKLSNSISSAEGATGTTLRVIGSAAETLEGTVNVSVTDIQSGTLELRGSSASLGAVTVGAGAGLSATGSSQTLNLSAVVQNQGTLSLGGVSTLTFMVSDVFDSFSYTDTVTGAGAKNGFINRYWLIRNSGSGAIENLSVADVTVNGASKNASFDGTGLYAAVEAADLGVTDGTNLNSIYVVNEGNVVYNAASNSSGNDTVKQLWLTGGTLELDQSDIKAGVGVHVKQDSTVNIGTNRTLTDSQVASVASGATLTLTGSGTYSLAVGQIGETASLTSGVALATGESGFTGTVLLNKGTTLNGTDLSALTNGSYSSVTMNGVSGTLKSGAISTNLVLVDYSVEVDKKMVTTKALTINGAGTITFGGTISGSGEMEIAPTADAAENTLIFSGDVSGWTGKLVVAAGKANVTFTGAAKEINAYVADTFNKSVLNMVVDASESRSFTQGISADTLRLTNGTEGKVVDVSGGTYIVSTKTDLTESNVILQVKGIGSEDSNLYSSLTELASDGSSCINISDSEKTLTTIRTNTQDASSSGNATLSSCTFTYNNSTAKISGSTIDRAVIDVVNGSTLELSSVVLTNSCWVHDDDASTPAPTGKLVLNGVELQMAKGTASTEDGSGVALTLTGGTTAATNADGSAKTLTGKVYVMDLTQISDFATISGSGSGLTLNFDTYGNGFAELYETLKGYDYVAVKFSDDVLSVDFKTLKVTSKITNGQNDVATSQGYYYNNNGTSGVVVYFDAIALPEPTTSTLGLLALAALCARRRRSRTRAHAEHA